MDTLAQIGIFIGGAAAVLGFLYGFYWVFDAWLIPTILRGRARPLNLQAIAEEVAAKAGEHIRSRVRDYEDGLTTASDRKRAEFYHEGMRLKGDRYFERASALFREALERPGGEGERVALLILAGNCFLSLGDIAQAEAGYRQAETLAASINEAEGRAIASGNLATVKQIKDDLEGAFAASPDLGIKQRIEMVGLFMDGLKSQLGNRR